MAPSTRPGPVLENETAESIEKSLEAGHAQVDRQATSDGLNEITFPDGGLRAWLTVLGSWLVLFATFGMVNAYGVFQDFYVRSFLTTSTPSNISWIGSTQVFLQFALGMPMGKLFDEGYFRIIMVVGAVVFTLSNFMLSLARPEQYYQVFLSQGLLGGLGLGIMFLPAFGIVSHHFKQKRALALGIVSSGSSCGGLVFPTLLNKLFAQLGFAWGVRIAAFLVLVLLVIANMLMTTRLPPRKKSGQEVSIINILKDMPYVISFSGASLICVGIFFPIFYLQLLAIDNGIDPDLAFYLLAILNGASLIGRVVPNFIADKLGTFNMLIPFSTLTGILILILLAVHTPAGFIIFAVFYGVASGSYISLLSPMFASLSSHIGEVGLRMGIAFSVISFFALTGTPIEGALLTSERIWIRPVIFSSVAVLAGAALLAVTRHMVAKSRGTHLL